MLTGVSIKNFRCLRDVTIQLEPLTIVVGPNAAGKSSLLKALDPHNPPVKRQDFWRAQPGECERAFHFSDGASRISRSGMDQVGNIKHYAGSDISLTYQFLQLDPSKLRDSNAVAEARQLARDGSNLANVIATLTRRQQEQLASEFTRLVPVYGDMDVRPVGTGHHRIVLQDRWRDIWYEPHNVSDGSLLVLALLTIAYQEPSPDLIAIEELERGLHPYLIGEILSILRKMTRGDIAGKQLQIVLATHSAELLEFADPKEVRFLKRTDDGGVTVEEAPISAPDWEQVIRDHQGSLGTLWLSGGLGGVPGGIEP
jgi:predicted ATPase